jgi:hypothetical protein
MLCAPLADPGVEYSGPGPFTATRSRLPWVGGVCLTGALEQELRLSAGSRLAARMSGFGTAGGKREASQETGR